MKPTIEGIEPPSKHGVLLAVNNDGILTLDQIEPDGPIYGNDSNNKDFVISTGDMVLLLDWYRYRESIGAPIFGVEESTVNDIRALLKMLRMDVLGEPVRSLVEKLRQEFKIV